MSIVDPVSDLLTRIRNAQAVGHVQVACPNSKQKVAVLAILQSEGYIKGHRVEDRDGKSWLSIDLKYYEGKPVIAMLKRISRPGLRCFKKVADLPVVQGGLGIAIVSTSKGVMTATQARKAGHGGEVICLVA